MIEINRTIYQTTDGTEFLNKNEAKRHQDVLDRTFSFAIKINSGPSNKLDELINKEHGNTFLPTKYIKVIADEPELMLEEYMYYVYGSRVGYKDRQYIRWEYKQVTEEEVQNESNINKDVDVVDGYTMIRLKEQVARNIKEQQEKGFF